MSDANVIDPTPRRAEAVPEPEIIVEVVNSAEDIDYLSMAPKVASSSILNSFAADPYPIMNFQLVHTSIRARQKLVAKVRVISLTERAVLDVQPKDVRELVHRLLFSNNQAPVKVTGLARDDQAMDRLKELCYVYACAGFVEPRLVLRKENVRDPETEAWVGSIALPDLHEFYRICEGDDNLAARRLEEFSDE